MAGDCRLGQVEDLNEVADAHFPVGHEVQEPKTGAVTERPKQPLHELGVFSIAHAPILPYIFALTYMIARDIICAYAYMNREADTA